ncbi:MAG: hypothetical protein Q4B86_00615 [Eubacteriales bacterium]|nr:hypothetical protein [Eubacteriales bacterium]
MNIKNIRLALSSLVFSAFISMSAFAAWQQNDQGYWWQNPDGSYPANSWQWIDGNNDGISECYYFNADGYMAADTVTEDGNTVNADGAWVENGIVVTKSTENYTVNKSEATASGNENTQSSSFKLGDLNVYMINEFTNAKVTSNLPGSYIIKSEDGNCSVGIMMVDTSVSESLHELVMQMEDLGVDFNTPEIKETFINSIDTSFVKLYGNEDSRDDSEFKTGTWRHLHYNEKQFYISNKPVPTDVYFYFHNMKSYTVIISGCEDASQFMNNNISWQ